MSQTTSLVPYCPTEAKDLNSLECETEKNYFKVFYLSSQIIYRQDIGNLAIRCFSNENYLHKKIVG